MTFHAFLDLPDSVAPDYQGGSLLNLMASIGRRFGAATAGQPPVLRDDAALGIDQARVVVFLLIDGLGACDVARRGAASFLARHQLPTLTSVFPSTTASAVTTSLTGLAPAAHGLTGWHIRDPRFGGIFAPLPMQRRDREPMTGWWRIPRLFPYPSLFQRLRCRSAMISPTHILGSPFNMRHSRGVARRYPTTDLASLEEALVCAVKDLGGPGGFVYAYHPDYDALAHQFGVASAQCTAHFMALDTLLERVHRQLAGQDALLLVTADHGFIDAPVDKQIRLDQHPEVYDCLAGPLWGERRVAYCRIAPGAGARFEAAARPLLKDRVDIVPSQALIDAGLFGPAVKPNRRLRERVGDYTLIGRTGWTVFDVLPQEREATMIGVHAGISADEMLIPLAAIQC